MSSTPTFVPPSDPLADPLAPPQAPPESGQPTLDPATGEWFLDAGDGTRYKDAAAAAAGTRERNAYIARLESQLNAGRQAFGVGPQPQAAPDGPDYLELIEQSIKGHNRLFQSAVERDAEAITERKFAALMAPFRPLMGQAALHSATRIAASGPKGDPNITAFVEGGGLDKFKVEYPEMGEVLTVAEQSPELYSRLPGLLRTAFRVASAGAPAAPATPGTRLPGSSSTPATPVTGPLAPNATSEARRQWLLDQPLESLFTADR